MPKALEKTIRVQKHYTPVSLRSETLDEKDRSVEVMWSSGIAVKRYDWDDGFYMEELSMEPEAIRMERFDHGMSLLDSHDDWSMRSRLGTVIPGSVRIENGKGYARVKFSRNPDAEMIFQDLLDGHPIQISVGYAVHRFEKVVTENSKYPTLRATDWEPQELSVVPVPAEPGAASRSEKQGADQKHEAILVYREDEANAASAASIKETPMNKRDAAKSYTGDKLDALALGAGISRSANETDEALRIRLLAAFDAEDKARAEAEAEATRNADAAAAAAAEAAAAEAAKRTAPKTTPAPAPSAADVAEQSRAAVAAERKRTKDINDLARSAGFAADDELVRKALDEGVEVEAFRSQLFDKMIERQAASPTFPMVETRGMQDGQETMRRMVANAILHRSGLVDKLEDGAREWRGMPTMDIVKEIMRARGESVRGSVHDVAARALHTTSDFPIILQDITNQVVLSAYTKYENTFQLIASRKVLSDYRETKVIDIGSAPDLLLKNEHGEFKAGTIRESEEGMKLQRYGRSIGFTHEMLVNDQLDAFMDVVRNWGLKVAKLEGDIVWGAILQNALLLKDGKALFHADHKNLATAGTVLDIANLKAARLAYRTQKDIDGESINISPKYLFVGADLEVDAQTLVATNTTPTVKSEVVPEAIKSLVPVYEHRIDSLTTKAWFLFADINQAMGRGIHYLHLLGHETPTTAEQIGFRIEGVEFTIAHSFGVGLTDYRYAYKNPGVAK